MQVALGSYLRAHEDEAKCVDSSHQGIQYPGVPRLVGLVLEGIDGIANHNGVQCIAEVDHGFLVILLGLRVPAIVQQASSEAALDTMQEARS